MTFGVSSLFLAGVCVKRELEALERERQSKEERLRQAERQLLEGSPAAPPLSALARRALKGEPMTSTPTLPGSALHQDSPGFDTLDASTLDDQAKCV